MDNNTTTAKASELLGDFEAATSYVRAFDVSPEEWVDTIGEAIVDLVRDYAEAHGASPVDVANVLAAQFEAEADA